MKNQEERMCISGNMRLAHKFITNYREHLGFQGVFGNWLVFQPTIKRKQYHKLEY